LKLLWAREREIRQQEGVLGLLKASLLFFISPIYQHNNFYLFEQPVETGFSLSEFEPRLKTDNLVFKVVSSNQEADKLEIENYKFRSYSTGRQDGYSKRLDQGAIAFCTFVNTEFAAASWIVPSQQVQNRGHFIPIKIDYCEHEACTRGAWVAPKYRGLGLYRYHNRNRNLILAQMGIKKLRGTVDYTQKVGIAMSMALGYRIYGTARLVKILFWKFWKESYDLDAPHRPSKPPIIAHITLPSQTPTPSPNSNIFVDHTNWDWYENQSSSVFDGIANLKIFFAHASVGASILRGLKDLNSANSTKYPLIQITSGGVPPAATPGGTIFEYPRGNPPWSVKIRDFESYVNNGWNDTKIDLVMNKFCYIDQKADWAAYRDSMTALEIQYPATKFIYWTMALTTTGDSKEVLRSQFNEKLRIWFSTQNNKILFDIADIEAWSPDGIMQTFTNKGTTYQKLYEGYSSDGGHLNEKGMNRTATGLYSLFGRIIIPNS
jgi:hypothetical protein